MIVMCDDKRLTESFKNENGRTEFRLVDGVPDWIIPKDLFKNNKKTVTMEEIIEWCCDRVFPRERMGAKELLKELGLDSYDEWSIAKETRASLMTDFYWIAIQKGDRYETHSARGRAKFTPVEW